MNLIKKLFTFPVPLQTIFTPLWLVIFGTLVTADLASKKIVTDNLRFHLSYSQAGKHQPLTDEERIFLTSREEKIDILGQEGELIKFRLVFNDRFAFSLGPDNSVLGFFISFCAIIFLFFYRSHNPGLGHPAAWLLIFSGALGNLIDKVFVKSLSTGEWMFSLTPQRGYVTGVVDFIECIWFAQNQWSNTPLLSIFSWETWPTFNVADSCVTVGISILLVTLLLEKPEASQEKESTG